MNLLALAQQIGDGEALGAAATEGGFSFFGLLMEADIVVKFVLIALFVASLWSWAVIVEKLFTVGSARKKAKQFEDAFWTGRADDLDGRPGTGNSDPASRLFASISREWNDARRLGPSDDPSILVDRAERSLRAGVDREVGRVSKGLGVLATIGSSSPFIGLFGTVWGIMNAFINIAEKQDTSLTNVAGPIAEALFATGLGLIAAIPAVIFYNKFTGDLNQFADRLDTFSQDLLVRLSRRSTDGGA
ncbi:protein TolQ [Henriciella mobilis]|uniref:Protein TolQ n=1 Tax=Henriciella mobilis TaxID=2305467 RepID=A0A399RF98_9PROT|nr:protein TolQ [Henriciella mobilis]RIJ18018.1 protein TolQ [Henriciella mobilis]RIJ25173.1 protein TolQ [Henriciella mobilis]RIJ30236.1 protein TolQ [Henriciella mobilis]